jgi:hypothetical protein
LTGTEEVFGTGFSILAIFFAENLLCPLPTHVNAYKGFIQSVA